MEGMTGELVEDSIPIAVIESSVLKLRDVYCARN
jgi:hypothetical protein